MILFRHLSRSFILPSLATLIILELLVSGSQLGKIISNAALYNYDLSDILRVMGYEFASALRKTIAPAFFAGCLFTMNTLNQSHARVILMQTGSGDKIIWKTLALTTFAWMIFSSFVSLWLSPWGYRQLHEFTIEKASLPVAALVQPGEFKILDNSGSTIYADSANTDGSLSNVFFWSAKGSKNIDLGEQNWVSANSSHIVHNDGARFMVFNEGQLVTESNSGTTVSNFNQMSIKLNDEKPKAHLVLQGQTTQSMLSKNHPWYDAERNWRFLSPFYLLMLALWVPTLAKYRPRATIGIRIGAAILFFFITVTMAESLHTASRRGAIPLIFGPAAMYFILSIVPLVIHILGKERR